MPKKKDKPFALGHPKTSNPMKEMSWAETRHIRISCEIEALKVGKYWEMGNKYKLTIRQGDRYKDTGYDYTKDNVVDAIYEAYRELYRMNYGKRQESGD